MKYIHYGSSGFDPERWEPIQNCYFVKPHGGLWASPVDTDFGWRDWCRRENFHLDNLCEYFEFELAENARVLELRPENIKVLPRCEEQLFGRLAGIPFDIDFETLSRGYDVLECSLSDYPQLYWDLYGWDCDSILVMNPDVIVL